MIKFAVEFVAVVGVVAVAAAAFSPSLRIFTSPGSTNSAVNKRPPCGGHCRLYKALRVAAASSTVEYYKCMTERVCKCTSSSNKLQFEMKGVID